MTDISNQQQFAQGILDSTLDTLRDQTDRAGILDLDGYVSINPQSFGLLQASPAATAAALRTPRYLAEHPLDNLSAASLQNRHMVIPVQFSQQFKTVPTITFGQAASNIPTDIRSKQAISNYQPFLILPYVYEWTHTNGVVGGFSMGLYAITAPPVGVISHSISWRATGKSSRYSDEPIAEAWSESYDINDADFLTDNAEDWNED